MKNYLNLALTACFIGLIIATSLKAQETNSIVPIDEDTKKITYQEVVNAKGTADDLYVRGIAWINSYYKNPTDVTKVRNREDALIQGIARFQVTYVDEEEKTRPGGLISYEIKLEFKEGRYRYTITNYNYKQVSRFAVEKWLNKDAPAYNPQWEEYIKQVDTYTKSLIADLNEGMIYKEKKEDEW